MVTVHGCWDQRFRGAGLVKVNKRKVTLNGEPVNAYRI